MLTECMPECPIKDICPLFPALAGIAKLPIHLSAGVMEQMLAQSSGHLQEILACGQINGEHCLSGAYGIRELQNQAQALRSLVQS